MTPTLETSMAVDPTDERLQFVLEDMSGVTTPPSVPVSQLRSSVLAVVLGGLTLAPGCLAESSQRTDVDEQVERDLEGLSVGELAELREGLVDIMEQLPTVQLDLNKKDDAPNMSPQLAYVQAGQAQSAMMRLKDRWLIKSGLGRLVLGLLALALALGGGMIWAGKKFGLKGILKFGGSVMRGRGGAAATAIAEALPDREGQGGGSSTGSGTSENPTSASPSSPHSEPAGPHAGTETREGSPLGNSIYAPGSIDNQV